MVLNSAKPSHSELCVSLLRMAHAVRNALVMTEQTENLIQNGELPEITSANFIPQVLASHQPVLVAFGTPWSAACHAFDSVLQELAAACAGKVKLVKVNADDSLDLSLAYDIQSVPTLLCFHEGNPRWRIVGTATAAAIRSKLNGLLE